MTAKKRNDDDSHPPIVRKVAARRRHGGSHGAWKVAYSDFVTSMMALFIVLWAAGQSPEIRASIGNYFRNPTILPANAGVLPASTGAVGPSPADAADEGSAEGLDQVAGQIRSALEGDPDLRGLRDQVRIEMTPEGLRIQIAERDDSLFFEIGSAEVKPALTRLLTTIARIVGTLPNEVAVEGHTDTRQYAANRGRGYSNWELSADRANSARRVLEAAGLRPRQVVRVVGFADHDLLLREDPLNAQNRRVSVIVRKLHAQPVADAAPPGAAAGAERLQRLSARTGG